MKEHMRAIFAPEHYPSRDEPAKFWLPLLGAYSGCRLGELVQLCGCDVKALFLHEMGSNADFVGEWPQARPWRYHAAVEALRFASAWSTRNASIKSVRGRLRRSRVLAAAGSPPCASRAPSRQPCGPVPASSCQSLLTRRVGAPRPLPDLY